MYRDDILRLIQESLLGIDTEIHTFEGGKGYLDHEIFMRDLINA